MFSVFLQLPGSIQKSQLIISFNETEYLKIEIDIYYRKGNGFDLKKDVSNIFARLSEGHITLESSFCFI